MNKKLINSQTEPAAGDGQKTMTENQTLKIANQSGFSLMELLIVMVIMLVIIAATFSLMQSSITTANANFELTTATQGLRNSQEYITRDILVAGDGLKGVSNIWLPTTFATEYLTVRSAAELDPSNRGFVSVGSILSDANVPADVDVRGANPATTVKEHTDRITMLAIDPNFASIDVPAGSVNLATGEISIPSARISDFTVGEVYYITSGGTGAFGTVTRVDSGANVIAWEEGAALTLTRSGSLGVGTNFGSNSASLRRVGIIHYFVDADGRLIRRAFGVQSNSFVDSVIAEHLKSLQFRYTLKPSGAGTVFEQPKSQITLDEAVRVRLVEPRMSVTTAYRNQDGENEQIDGVVQVGVRNVQFLEAPVPVDSQGNTTLPNPGPTPEITPTPSPTPPPTPEPPPPPTPDPTPTPIPTPTPDPTPVPSPTPTPEPTPTPTPTPVPTPTPTPDPTPTASPTPKKTPKPGKGDG